MNNWKIWIITGPVLLVMIAIAVMMWLWSNISTTWSPEQDSAQFVLNHTPIRHIQSYEVFTASGLEDVFHGTDVFHHGWYAFYIPSEHTAYSVPETTLMKPKAVTSELKAAHIQPSEVSVGYVTSDAMGTLKPVNHVVYEVLGKNGTNDTYIYIDATTGKVLWKYVL